MLFNVDLFTVDLKTASDAVCSANNFFFHLIGDPCFVYPLVEFFRRAINSVSTASIMVSLDVKKTHTVPFQDGSKTQRTKENKLSRNGYKNQTLEA
jgi:hypothetical protein